MDDAVSFDPLEEGDMEAAEELYAHAFDFERLVATWFARQGMTVVSTGGKRELGADFVAEKDGFRLVVQVKCSVRQVGVRAVRQAYRAMASYSAQSARVVTNSYFSWQAEQLAAELGVRLTARDGFVCKLDSTELQEFMRIDRAAQANRRKIALLPGGRNRAKKNRKSNGSDRP